MVKVGHFLLDSMCYNAMLLCHGAFKDPNVVIAHSRSSPETFHSSLLIIGQEQSGESPEVHEQRRCQLECAGYDAELNFYEFQIIEVWVLFECRPMHEENGGLGLLPLSFMNSRWGRRKEKNEKID
nr:hypothetical protein Iba_chr14aCG5430 [Ipomoea batatas]